MKKTVTASLLALTLAISTASAVTQDQPPVITLPGTAQPFCATYPTLCATSSRSANLTNVYSGRGISFRYPQDWQVQEKVDQIQVAPREARLPLPDGREWLTHGLFVGFVESTGCDAEGCLTCPDANPDNCFAVERGVLLRGQGNWLQLAAKRLFRRFQQANRYMKYSEGDTRTLNVNGRNGFVIGYVNPDPASPLGPESGLLLVVQEGHGVWYWLMFYPADEHTAAEYGSLSGTIWSSIRFGQGSEPAGQSAATFQAESNEMALVQRILERFKQGKFQIPAPLINIDTSPKGTQSVNGEAYRSSNQIVVTLGAIHQLPEDELAFLIAHEFGHLMDMSDACESSVSHEKHECEDLADWTAEHIMLGSGYSGYAGAGLMGRFMMMGDRASFTNQLMITLFDTHRSEVGRTNNLLNAWRGYCTRFGCR